MKFLAASIACVFVVAVLPAFDARAAPQVFSLEKTGSGCVATVHDLAAAAGTKPRVLLTSSSKECPREVLIGKKVITVEGASIKAYEANGKATELAKLPVDDPFVSVWIEEGSKVRAAWLVTTGVELKDDALIFEGKRYSVKGDDAASFPPWGTPAVAILAELDGAGATAKWKRIEATPTKTEAGDTPGLMALSTPKNVKKGVIAVSELVSKMTCVGGVLECDAGAAAGAAAKKLVGVSEDVGIGTLALKSGAMVFAVMVGDTPHAFPPVHLCSDGAKTCAKSVVVEKKGTEQRQLGIATQGGFTIVSEEYSSENAKIVDANGKVVLGLPKSTSVVFLPEGFALP